MISIHALLAESDRYSLRHSAQSGYFYPRSPCGERPRIFLDLTFHKNFYPRSPCGERPRVVTAFWGSVDNFYPRSPCGERLSGLCKGANMAHFYPRSPCGERRCRPGNCTRCCAFLSTLSLRRATNTNLGRHRGNDDFYPRSPCGERLDMSSAYPAVQCISIHALLAESDALSQSSAKSTPEISIHALLAESDPPRGGYCYLDNIISIHALLAESDWLPDHDWWLRC